MHSRSNHTSDLHDGQSTATMNLPIVARATVGSIELAYELHGPAEGEPVMLICGALAQLSYWPDALIGALTEAGCRVLIFDNRDVGLSTRESRPAPDLGAVMGGDVSAVNYTLSDMAADAVGLIAAVGWESAHVLGHSMGAGIAQRMATEHPERVRSLTLFAGAPGDGTTGASSPQFLEAVLTPEPDDDDGRVEQVMRTYRVLTSPESVDEAELEAFVRRQISRAPNPKGQALPAIVASTVLGLTSTPTHAERLRQLDLPTLVLHGTGDLAIAFDGGQALAELIPGATFLVLEGMGHIPQDSTRWAAIADAVIDHVHGATARR